MRWRPDDKCSDHREIHTEKVDASIVGALHHFKQLVLADLTVILADRHPVAQRERRHLEARAAQQAVRHRRRRGGGVCEGGQCT